MTANATNRLSPHSSMKGKVEALAAKGFNGPQIVRELGCSPSYAFHVITGLHGQAAGDSARVSEERDAIHVSACLAQGGFVWRTVNPDGSTTEHRPSVR